MRRASVLIVEPDDDGRGMYVEYLRLRGFRVITAETTDAGLLAGADADVIVTGIRVPGSFDGLELVRRLRGREHTRHTPIIVLTACAFDTDRERAGAAGCDVFLSKPCLPDRLGIEIRRALALRGVPKPIPARAADTFRRRKRPAS